MKKRMLPLLLALLMVFEVLPVSSLAGDTLPEPPACDSNCNTEFVSNHQQNCAVKEYYREVYRTYTAAELYAMQDVIGENAWTFLVSESWNLDSAKAMELQALIQNGAATMPTDPVEPENPCGCCDSCTGAEGCECECGECDFCEKEEPTQPSQPENSCKCCDDCTGAEGCECECGECNFCEKEEPTQPSQPEEPVIPSISATIDGQTLTVDGKLPEGASLSVSEAIAGMDDGFAYDIKILDTDKNEWQPGNGQKVTLSIPVPGVEDGQYIELLHMLEDKDAILAAVADGMVWDEAWATSAFPAAAAAYEAITGETGVALEVLTPIVYDGVATASVSGFSIYVWNGSAFQQTDTGDELKIVFHATATQGDASGTYYVTKGQKIRCDRGGIIVFDREWQTSADGTNFYYNTDHVLITKTEGGAMDESGSGANVSFTVDSNAPAGTTFWIRCRIYHETGFFNYKWSHWVTIKFVIVDTWNINFYNGSSKISTDTIVTGSGTLHDPITWPSNPSKSGYTFRGWSTVNTGTSVINKSTWYPVQPTTNLYAVFTYDVTYNLNGGSGTSTTQTVNSNDNVTLHGSPTRVGYTFAGWKSSADGAVYNGGATYSGKKTTTMTANWTANPYTVTYDVNGATSGTIADQTRRFDEEFTLPTPKKEYSVSFDNDGNGTVDTTSKVAYTFNGWEDRGTIVYNGVSYDAAVFDGPYYANTYGDLYNAFKYNKYDLIGHYVNNGMKEGKSPVGSTRSYYYASRLTVKNLASTNVTVPLKANWSPNSITLPTLSEVGKLFRGWSDGTTTYAAGASYTPSKDVTLTAVWETNGYKLTFDFNDGTGTTSQYQVISGSSNYYEVKWLNPARSGYAFDGWYTAATGGTQVYGRDGYCLPGDYWNASNQWIGTADLTVYAHWVPSYKVTLDNQSATTPGTEAYWYIHNKVYDGVYYYTDAACTTALANYTITKPTKTGYLFGGYYTGKNGTGTQYVNADGVCVGNRYQIAEDVTLYAKWTPITYQVKYDGNPTTFGTTMENSIHTYDVAKTLTPNGYQRSGYMFMGWNTKADGSGKTYADQESVVNLTNVNGSTVTLYAQWEPIYKITLDSQEQTIAAVNFYFVHTLDVYYSDNNCTTALTDKKILPPSKNGYTFAGFYTETGGKGTQYVDKDGNISSACCQLNQDTTLYAAWDPITYTITYQYNDGERDDTTQTYNYETDVKLMVPERVGYKFLGWTNLSKGEDTNNWKYTNYDNASTGMQHPGYNQYGDVMLQARWEDQYRYVLKFDANGGENAPEQIVWDWADDAEYTFTWTQVPTREGYTFQGWAEASDSQTNVAGSDYNAYKITGNKHETVEKTLFAIWQRDTGDLKLTFNGGEATPAIVTVTGQGKTITLVLTQSETVIKDLPTGQYSVTAESGIASYTASVKTNPKPTVAKNDTAVVEITIASRGLNWFTAFFRVKNKCS